MVTAAGRRSGKTEVHKRLGVLLACRDLRPDSRTFFCAPTAPQARKIYWEDVKDLVPPQLVRSINETRLEITLIWGGQIIVAGLDAPSRIEGGNLDRIFLDEFADMRPHVWPRHVLPALGTTGRAGRAWIYGVPEGRNHFYGLAKEAQDPRNKDWRYYHWRSEEVLLPEDLQVFKDTLDPLTYEQEFGASFLNFEGRVYNAFDWSVNAIERLSYDPALPLIFCFDFNAAPGSAVVCQEQLYTGNRPEVAPVFTAVIGEVNVPQNSDTRVVCNRLLQDWGHHAGKVTVYGDASGGAEGSAKVEGSDWDLIAGPEGVLSRHFGTRFHMKVPKANPKIRPRVNSVNGRLLTMSGHARMLVDPEAAPKTCECLDGVTFLPGGSAFEIDKKGSEAAGLTHWSDALGYYIHFEFPTPSTGHDAGVMSAR
ncbi:MAG: hypothetical protein GY716_16135 [bacterium]|nr:hypothetical protein [bacterium]